MSTSDVRRREVDPLVAHHRARIGGLRRNGRHDEADGDARDLAARKLLLAARRTAAATPLPLTDQQVADIVDALRLAA